MQNLTANAKRGLHLAFGGVLLFGYVLQRWYERMCASNLQACGLEYRLKFILLPAQVVTCSSDGTVRVWDGKTADCITAFRPPQACSGAPTRK